MTSNEIFKNRRRIAARTAIGACATITLAAATSVGVLLAQVAAAKRHPMTDPRTAPEIGGASGPQNASRIKLVVLGDSLALSVGVTDPQDSLTGRLTAAMVEVGYRVELTGVAVSNSRSVDVRIQVSRALITSENDPYDVALIVVGAGDAMQWLPLDEIGRATQRSITALREAGLEVVLATCTDLGAAQCISRPLRTLWGWRSARIARMQAAVAQDAGATAVNLVSELGSLFRADPGMICADGFHPSADGYRLIAERLEPALTAACERSTKSNA
ncbi:MAG: SGNH/GDSL hydrolase family protein [Antricoccus sp.]